MKSALLALALLLPATVLAGPGGDVCSMAAHFKTKCEQPICKCDPLKSCVDDYHKEKVAMMKSCMDSCKTSDPIEGVDHDKLDQCHAAKMADKMKMKECVKEAMPAICDDGSGVTELPLQKKSKGMKKGKKMMEKAKKMMKKAMFAMLPDNAQGYFHCAMKCYKQAMHFEPEHKKEEEGDSGRRVKRGGHHGKMFCFEKLGCRMARTFTWERKKAIMKKCMNPSGMMQTMMKHCECAVGAGLKLDCGNVQKKIAMMAMDFIGNMRTKRDIVVPHSDPNVVCRYKEDAFLQPRRQDFETVACAPTDVDCGDNVDIFEEIAPTEDED